MSRQATKDSRSAILQAELSSYLGPRRSSCRPACSRVLIRVPRNLPIRETHRKNVAAGTPLISSDIGSTVQKLETDMNDFVEFIDLEEETLRV